MEKEQRKKLIDRLELIASDAKNDVIAFEGQPFNGKTVEAYFGYHAASIEALAKTIKEILNDEDNSDESNPTL